MTIDPYKPGGLWFFETKREKCNRKRVSDVIFPEQLLLFGRTSHFSHIIIIILFRNGKRTSVTAVRSNTKGIFIDLSYCVCTRILKYYFQRFNNENFHQTGPPIYTTTSPKTPIYVWFNPFADFLSPPAPRELYTLRVNLWMVDWWRGRVGEKAHK